MSEYVNVKTADGWKRKHVLIAEKILGKRLPKGVEVHHVNENKRDNRHANLVICPSAAYHRLLHKRTRAYDACGHADWLKCNLCKQYDDPKNLKLYSAVGESRRGRHHTCEIEAGIKRYDKVRKGSHRWKKNAGRTCEARVPIPEALTPKLPAASTADPNARSVPGEPG